MKNIFLKKVKFPKIIIFIFWIQFIFFGAYFYNKMEASLLIFFIGLILLGVFLSSSYTKLKITESHIEYGLIPLKKNIIKWNNVQKYEILKISALSDFLGWGIRYSKKFGWCYIMRGDYVLCLTLYSGKKRTISIVNKEELERFLEIIGK